MNNLFQQLNQNQMMPNKNLQQLIANFKNSSNPRDFLRQYIQNNPQVQNIYSMLQNSNRSPKDFFYYMAEQKGVDPDTILNMLK